MQTYWIIAALIVAGLTWTLRAQTAPASEPPQGLPEPVPQPLNSGYLSRQRNPPPTSMPATNSSEYINEYGYEELTLDGMTIDQVVDHLDQTAQTNYRVVRDADVALDYPKIDRLTLRNIKPYQVIDLLPQIFDGVTVVDPGNFQGQIVRLRSYPTYSVTTQTYTLPIIRDPFAEQIPNLLTLDNALSLIQAAVDQSPGPKAVLKYHPPTKTLIVKATPSQQKVVENAIGSLTRMESQQDTQGLVDQVKEYDQQLKSLKRELSDKSASTQPTAN